MWKNYHTVTSVAEALTLLAEHQGKARIVAGGTDMLIEMERGQRPNVEVLIDITRIPQLNKISIHGDHVRLGALVTHNQVVAEKQLHTLALPLVQACWEVGAPQIRNRATIAGNIITGSPANDTISPLMALEAEVTLASLDGERTVPLSEFYTGLRRTVMRADEMLVAISFDGLSANERGRFYKLGLRRAQAISVINVAAVLSFEGDNVRKAIITLGSVAPTIIRVPTAEQALVGKPLSAASIAEAARLAAATPDPIDDVRSTAEYRREMVRVLVGRTLTQIAENAPAITWGDAPAMLWGAHPHAQPSLTGAAHHDDHTAIETTINGQPYTIMSGQHSTLLDFLRDHAHLAGTKEGCAEGECGACTVYLDGAAVMACMVPAPRAHHAEIVTVEGLATDGQLHPIQEAFITQGAVQCGFCTPGFLMSGAKLLEEHPHPTQEQIQQSISGNLCRCTGYYKILQAFEQASQKISQQD